MTQFGFELEVRQGAANVLAHLREMGLTQHNGLHPYHCGCSDCEPADLNGLNGQPSFKAQEDCTCDGEFITGILEFGTPAAERAIVGISRALLLSRADVTGDVGNHVHVSRENMDGASLLRLTRLFVRYQTELQEIAAGPRAEVRGYNAPASVYNPRLWTDIVPMGARSFRHGWETDYTGGTYIAFKQHTVEFRLWNAVRSAWRIRTHVGLSVALVEAALNGADCVERDPRCVEDVIGPYMDAPTWAGVLRQRFSKGGFEVAA